MWFVQVNSFLFKSLCVCALVLLVTPLSMASRQRIERIPVTVTAYCPCALCCGQHADGKYCTGRRIKNSDYAIAITRDLERYFVLDQTRIKVPQYNKSGTCSTFRDRMSRRYRRRIDVLMTVHKGGRTPHQRALKWGKRHMVLVIENGAAVKLEEQ